MRSDAGIIYAFGMEGSSHVKIGKTTRPVKRRLAELQAVQLAPLHILATVTVKHNLGRIETVINRFLAEDRHKGEWFVVEMGQEQLERLVVRAVQWLEKEAIVAEQPLQVAARALSKLGASKGGQARFAKLTAEERKVIAQKAVQTRWRRKGAPMMATPIKPEEISDVEALLEAQGIALEAQGNRLRLTIAKSQPTTVFTLAGVKILVACLQAWIIAEEQHTG